MRILIFFILFIVALSTVGYVLHKNGMTEYIVDLVFSEPKEEITEEYCVDYGHTVGERDLDGKTYKVCHFKHGGWCEIGDFYDGRCGDA